jgi:hypothetical protein
MGQPEPPPFVPESARSKAVGAVAFLVSIVVIIAVRIFFRSLFSK